MGIGASAAVDRPERRAAGVMLDGTGLGAIGPELLLLADGFRQLPIALRPDSSTLTASLRQSACP